MTEEEAKTKWCPHARDKTTDYRSTATNRMTDSYSGRVVLASKCIASECMSWRWVRQGVETGDGPAERNLEHGYCGLAGKP